MITSKELNSFKRDYFDLKKQRYQGHIIHDPGTTPEHRKLVTEVCEWAYKNKMIYFTRVYLKTGKIVDVLIPELVRPFIEVRASEEKKDKIYLDEYSDLIQFVDVSDPYRLL